MLMTPYRSKQVSDKIIEQKFKKNEFSFSPTHEERFSLKYNDIPHFSFDVNENKHVYGRPGLQGKMDYVRSFKTWEDVLSMVGEWLENLRHNIDIGNPWEDVNSSSQKIFNGNEEEILNDEDRKFIDEKLDIILEALSTMDININAIRVDLEHLKKSSEQISKKDWQLMFYGSLFGWVVNETIPKESINNVFSTIMTHFKNIRLIG